MYRSIALRPSRRIAACAARPRTVPSNVRLPAWAQTTAEAGRLRDQRGVEAVVALQRGERPEAAVLLARHAQEHDLGRRRARVAQRRERVQAGDHARLHVDRAAPVHARRPRSRPTTGRAPRAPCPGRRRRRARRGRCGPGSAPRSVTASVSSSLRGASSPGWPGWARSAARSCSVSSASRPSSSARRQTQESAARSWPVTLGIWTSSARSAASAAGSILTPSTSPPARGASCRAATCSSSSSREAGRAEGVEQPRQPGRVAELGGHRRAVEVAAERDRVDPGHLGDVRGVGDDQLLRRVRVVGAVGAEEAGVEVDADEAAALADRAQLVVGEVARRGAQRVGAGVGGDERRAAVLERVDVPEPAAVQVGDVDEDPQLVAGRDERRPALERPGPSSGLPGEPERHAGGEVVRAAPGQPERAHPRGVEQLELLEPRADRLGALEVQDGDEARPRRGRRRVRATRMRPSHSRSSRRSRPIWIIASRQAGACGAARSTSRPRRRPRAAGR